MPRFIKTYYDNEVVIERMLGCQTCPLFKFYKKEYAAVCRQYVERIGTTNTIKTCITTYEPITKKVIEKLPFPTWCKLPDKLSNSYFGKEVFRITPTSINITHQDADIRIKVYDSETYQEINVDIDTLVWDRRNNLFEESQKAKQNIHKIQKSNIGYERDSDNYRQSWDDFKIDNPEFRRGLNSTTTVKKLKCSLCGREDKNVDRKKHFGMCDDCWELSDAKTKKRAFINNFRLKRDIDFTHNSFKPIKELKIKNYVK